MTKMKNQKLKRKGRLACITTQAPAKAQRCQYVIASECEAIQPIEKDVNRHEVVTKAQALIPVTT